MRPMLPPCCPLTPFASVPLPLLLLQVRTWPFLCTKTWKPTDLTRPGAASTRRRRRWTRARRSRSLRWSSAGTATGLPGAAAPRTCPADTSRRPRGPTTRQWSQDVRVPAGASNKNECRLLQICPHVRHKSYLSCEIAGSRLLRLMLRQHTTCRPEIKVPITMLHSSEGGGRGDTGLLNQLLAQFFHAIGVGALAPFLWGS